MTAWVVFDLYLVLLVEQPLTTIFIDGWDRLDAVRVGHRYLILGERILDRIERLRVIVS